jgi:hypothetical protein
MTDKQPQVELSQTSIVLGAIVVAFIVYITTKGHLPKYIALLKGQK